MNSMTDKFDPNDYDPVFGSSVYFKPLTPLMIEKRELTAHEQAINRILFVNVPDGRNRLIVVINFPVGASCYGILWLKEDTGQLVLGYHVDGYGPRDVVREVFADGSWASTNQQPEKHGILEDYTWQLVETVDWQQTRYQWMQHDSTDLEHVQRRYEQPGQPYG